MTSRNRQNKAVCCLFFSETAGIKAGSVSIVQKQEAYYGDEWKLIAEVHIEYKDGTKDVISSDKTWSVTRSNLWFSNIYDGERRDDTLPPVEESPARIAKAPKGRLMRNGYLLLRYRRRGSRQS